MSNNFEQKLLWIIPNDQYENNGLEAGVPIFYGFDIGGRDHKAKTIDFCKKYGLTGYSDGGSHNDWGKYFSERGFAIFFNSGVAIEGKYYGTWYLPEQMTLKQIEFLESVKELFIEKYYSDFGFFSTCVYSSEPTSYKTADGMRNLKIEAIIENKKESTAIDCLYDEVDRQKKFVNNKSM